MNIFMYFANNWWGDTGFKVVFIILMALSIIGNICVFLFSTKAAIIDLLENAAILIVFSILHFPMGPIYITLLVVQSINFIVNAITRNKGAALTQLTFVVLDILVLFLYF